MEKIWRKKICSLRENGFQSLKGFCHGPWDCDKLPNKGEIGSQVCGHVTAYEAKKIIV